MSNVAKKNRKIDDFRQVDLSVPWSNASHYIMLREMSALCFLFARNLQDLLVKEGVNPPPIGLVVADWGGTPVEAWSPPKALQKCKAKFTAEEMNTKANQCRNSILWDNMVNPLKWNSVKGFLWYQGEKNSAIPMHRDLYQCTFPAMIKQWRREFSAHSSTKPNAPWGFVQLAQNFPKSQDNGWPMIRWHQTANVGYVPNKKMPNTFMTVSMDTYDEKLNKHSGQLHPMNKQTPALRLAMAGLNVAYGYSKYPTRGPWPSNMKLDDRKDAVLITYDQAITYNTDGEMSGFFVCLKKSFECDDRQKRTRFWSLLKKNAVSVIDDKN